MQKIHNNAVKRERKKRRRKEKKERGREMDFSPPDNGTLYQPKKVR